MGAGKAIGDGARRRGVAVLAAVLLLAGCAGNQPDLREIHDRTGNLSKDDYRALYNRTPTPPEPAPEAPIPRLQPVVAAPPPGLAGGDRIVSLTLTDTVPLKDVLVELARDADLNLELDPRISGGIVFSAREQPLLSVLERIADLAGLRFQLEGNFLRVELDEPYHRNYRLDYISLVRDSASQISIATNVFQAVGGAGGGTVGNNSTSDVRSASQADFWAELDTNLRQILENAAQYRALAQPLQLDGAAAPASVVAVPFPGSIDPTGTVSPQLLTPGAAPLPVLANGQPAPAAAPPGPAPAAPLPPAAAAASATGGRITSGPSAAAAATAFSAQNASTNAQQAVTPRFSINRQAGIVSVFASERTQRQVSEYLDRLRREIASQVLIEARIVEVTLNEDFRSGVNWGTLFGGDINFQTNLPFNADPSRPLGLFQLNVDSSKIRGLLPGLAAADPLTGLAQFVSSFGAVRTLSSPRLTVLNNQTAILKVAENQVYFTTQVEATPVVNADGSTTVSRTLTSTVNTVPIGVVMTVQPSINLDSAEVTMTLRPTISRIVRTVNDPAVTIVAADAGVPNLVSPIPVVEVREMDSVLRLRSRDIAIMGGLMQDRADNQESGIPLLKDLPVLGNAFKRRDEQSQVVELMIFLRASIVQGSPLHPQDVDLYRRYQKDPRPVVR